MAVCAAVSVRELVPFAEPVKVAGEKEAVMPAGSPAAVNVTVELKPADGVTETCMVAAAPLVIVAVEADELTAKVGVGTITVTAVVCVMPPPNPVIVIV